MKKLLLPIFLVSAGLAQSATPTLISFINAFGTCTSVGTSPAVIVWNGTKFVCATFGTGVGFNSTTNQIVGAAASTPVWQVETVGFNTLTTGATTLTYTTKQTPVAGVLLYFYSSGNLFTSSWGAVAFTGQPITITLPTGWQPTDSVTFVYASQ
jgi:hypothetical protein